MKKLLAVLIMAAGTMPAATASTPSCSEPFAPVTGSVATLTCASNALGGDAVFSYFAPDACTADHRCPVLYLLHGFGGDYTSMLGTPERPSTFVEALSGAPGTDDDLELILIAPDGRTVEAGAGAPPAGQESFWVDWNPRRWANPPRFEEHVAEELVGLVDASFPTIATREGRAIDGISLGGFGSFKLAFQHPDLYATAGSISGALNILVAPGAQPVRPPVLTPGAPAAPPIVHGPEVIQTPPGFPFGDPFGAFGDPTSSEAYFRGNNPLDLAVNGRGLDLRFFHNDTVSRDPARDMVDFPSFAGAQALESVVMPMNLEMVEALTQHQIPFEHEIHPGIHSGPYWDPYIRGQLEWHVARLSRAGAALPPEVPVSFTYRSVKEDFSVWGWTVHVEDREQEASTTLWDAGRDGVVLQGSGTITIETPAYGVTGVSLAGLSLGEHSDQVEIVWGERARITLDMDHAPSVTDEHGGVSTASTVRICLRYGEVRPSCPHVG